MSVIKSYSVGNGDMFYIRHGSDSFSIVDCCLSDEDEYRIVSELREASSDKGVIRFISSHPDDDHMRGLAYLDSQLSIPNFYCVKNAVTKEEETEDFLKYCELRDSDKASYLFSGCSRKWLNQSDGQRQGAGIQILWPQTGNAYYQSALDDAAEGGSPNNISPIVKYSLEGGVTMLWMGDLETDFMENVKGDLALPRVDVLFAPHHGRDSGKVPTELLEQMNPRIVVIGEAPAEHLNYYAGYDTITQNSAGDISFDCGNAEVHISVSDETYSVDFLVNRWQPSTHGRYLGTLVLD